MSRIAIVSGAIANKPQNGGEAWVRLSWTRGMQRLGFRVVFVEQLDPAHDDAVAYFKQVTRSFGLAECSALIDSDGRTICGVSERELLEAATSAQVLINISGHLRCAALMERLRRKVYLDIDPGYTQIWHEQGLAPVGGHDFYYTIGRNIGSADCPIPTGGIEWRKTLQPVMLADWPVQPPPKAIKFTTVGAWRGSFGTVTHNGNIYGQKAHEFRKVFELPRRSPHRFEIALQIHEGDAKDRAALEQGGWRIVDPGAVAADPQAFRRYVHESAAEFSVAQGMYVQTRSGWFSDRTVRYLASGRPALVQSTGDIGVPSGVGILLFDDLEGAVADADKIVKDYARHSHAARELAERYFDSDKVLGKLLNEVGLSV